MGTGGTFIHNAVPATLIGINTFGAHILMGVTLPLLLITPFTLHIMFPSLAATSLNDSQKDLSRGELVFYEKDGNLLNGVFVICCKYVLLLGIRVSLIVLIRYFIK